MAYSLNILPNASIEIEKAFQFYENISENVLNNFNDDLEYVFQTLETNPHFQVRHKHLRAITLKKFPFLIFYDIDEIYKEIYNYSFFLTHKNPDKYPTK